MAQPRNAKKPAKNALAQALAMRDDKTIDMVEAAVRHGDVLLAYQPVIQAQQPDRIAFYEGLIRVMDETGRIIPAKDFIDLVEERETGRVLDCLALEKGLQTIREVPTLRLSINMSARSIGYRKWMRILERGLSKDPTVAERLILEITERSAMIVPELVVNFMDELQRKGVSFALDDFGAGYTSFRYLRDFSFDILKIDGQFIRDIHANPDNQVLTRALVSIAQQFDMFTVAEMIENEEDVAFLRSIGVDCLQGFIFGAPTVTPPWADTKQARRA